MLVTILAFCLVLWLFGSFAPMNNGSPYIGGGPYVGGGVSLVIVIVLVLFLLKVI